MVLHSGHGIIKCPRGVETSWLNVPHVHSRVLTQPCARGLSTRQLPNLTFFAVLLGLRSSFVISASAQVLADRRANTAGADFKPDLALDIGPLNPLFPVSLQRPEHLGPRWMAETVLIL